VRLGYISAVFCQRFLLVKFAPSPFCLSDFLGWLAVSLFNACSVYGKKLLCRFSFCKSAHFYLRSRSWHFQVLAALVLSFLFLTAFSGFVFLGRCGSSGFIGKFLVSLFRVCFSSVWFVASSFFGFLRSWLQRAGFFVWRFCGGESFLAIVQFQRFLPSSIFCAIMAVSFFGGVSLAVPA